jgi:phosphatidylserine synthase
MSDLMSDAAWVLTVTFAISIAYELYRSTIRAGVSEHDTMRGFVVQLPGYAVAAVVIALLFVGEDWAAWVGLAFCVLVILISITYYNPRIMIDRRPTLIDWFEDLVFTGLLFVAATQLVYELTGR